MPELKGPKRLPDRPSREHLRKAAKRIARTEGVKLTRAQFQLARSYGFRSWSALMREVDARARPAPSKLSAAAARGDVALVRVLLAEGAAVEGEPHEINSPLFLACGSDAAPEARLRSRPR